MDQSQSMTYCCASHNGYHCQPCTKRHVVCRVIEMPQKAAGWTYPEEVKLVDLIVPHPCLYNQLDPLKKNLLQREQTWAEIAEQLNKSVDDCKKRWRNIRDSFMRCRRIGKESRAKAEINRKLQKLEGLTMDFTDDSEELMGVNSQKNGVRDRRTDTEVIIGTKQEVITDNQKYYEITVVENEQPEQKPVIKLIPKSVTSGPDMQHKKIGRKNCGRKRSMPMPRNLTPVKILPKPISMNGSRVVQYIEHPKPVEQPDRLQNIDKLIEKVLKENTNEIDVFFRSMAASVKKLQPSLIPKVKMEVCNVVAKYEMQSFEKM